MGETMEARVKALPEVLVPSKDDDDFDIVIPALQRDYRWECQNINEMFDDLATHFCNFSPIQRVEEDYFFGSVVYVKNEDEKRFYLIDGQQRLTTFSLVLRKSFDLLNSELENVTGGEDEDTSRIEEVKSQIQEMLFDKNGKCRIKFDADRHEKQYILESILSLDRNDKKLKELKNETNEHTINYINRYNNISKKLDELLGKDVYKIKTFYDQITKHVQFVRIISKDENTVYQLFETLNARGENLSQTELLKNYLLSRIEGESERFESLWQETSTYINSIQNSSKKAIYSFDVILRNYYFLLQGEKVTQSKVYVKYKEYFKNKTEKEILHDLMMLRDATKTISTKIYNRDSSTYSLFDFCLNQLQITQMIPTLLLISFSDDKDVCQECIDLLTKYVCILWISESPYNKLEQLNKEMFSNKLDVRNQRDIHERIVATTETIKNEISKLENGYLQRTIEFRMFEKKQHAALRQFLVAIFNRFHDEHQFKAPTLEHINPQCGIDNFKDRGFASDTEYSDYVKKIGNAVVLGSSSNSEAQHKWDQKMKVYKNPGQPKNVVMLFKKLGSNKDYDELLDQNFYVDLPSMNDGSEYLTKDEIDLRTRKFAESISKILLNTNQ